jgi:hypothetical protein
MKVCLINIDNYPNLALEKIRLYWKDKGADITDFPMECYTSDKTYVSVIFDYNKNKAMQFEGLADIGGSGYDYKNKLSDEIDKLRPLVNYGFTTRGCIRKCYFCIVPQKEGSIKVETDIYGIWDKKAKDITLMDNNILALPEHFFLIAEQLKREKLRVDFNQGLDFRLLNTNIIKEILSLRHTHEIRFAFDNVAYYDMVENALIELKNNGLKDWKSRWYIYIGEKDTPKTVMTRLELLRKYKQAVYVMRDKKVYNVEWVMALSEWGNTMGAFKMGSFKDCVEKSKRLSCRKNVLQEVLNA